MPLPVSAHMKMNTQLKETNHHTQLQELVKFITLIRPKFNPNQSQLYGS